MTLQMVTCPLCCQPGFNTSDALCSALVSSSTRKLSCPICNDILIGLDKLTIHLFGHNSLMKSPSSHQNSGCHNKLLAAPNARDVGNPLASSVLYIQTDNGQLFALAPSSLLNQFSTVTINTQNYISNTSVSNEPNFVQPRNPVVEVEKPIGFSSCKDLLASGDFSESLEETPDVAIESNSSAYVDNVQNSSTIHQNVLVDPTIPDSPSKCLPDAHENFRNNQSTAETESPKHLIPCDICELGFSNKAILAVHKQLMHKNHVASETGDGVPKNAEKSRKKPLSCNWCTAAFNLKSSLMIHVKVTHPAQKESFERREAEKVTCPICGKVFPKESMVNQHMKTAHGDKPWQCTVCSKSFTTKYFLRKHKRIHTGETPYECAICHKVFTFQQSYHKHMLYHTDDKPYCCSHCGRLFKELSTLNNHERIHSGEKPFACETCGKSFRQRVSYLVHRRIHTGAMPYKCTACNKSFRYKISQRTHKCPEHPPGVVVKTHNSLVDRLQAVINLENKTVLEEAENAVDSFNDQLASSPLKVKDSMSSNFSHPGPKVISPEGEFTRSGSPSAHFPAGDRNLSTLFNSGKYGTAQSSHNLTVQTGAGPDLCINTEQTFLEDVSFNEVLAEGQIVANSPETVDVFPINLDSSPSECLGKLHISSNGSNQSSACSPQTQKRLDTPLQSLSFDNMEDLDLCKLLFDVS